MGVKHPNVEKCAFMPALSPPPPPPKPPALMSTLALSLDFAVGANCSPSRGFKAGSRLTSLSLSLCFFRFHASYKSESEPEAESDALTTDLQAKKPLVERRHRDCFSGKRYRDSVSDHTNQAGKRPHWCLVHSYGLLAFLTPFVFLLRARKIRAHFFFFFFLLKPDPSRNRANSGVVWWWG